LEKNNLGSKPYVGRGGLNLTVVKKRTVDGGEKIGVESLLGKLGKVGRKGEEEKKNVSVSAPTEMWSKAQDLGRPV